MITDSWREGGALPLNIANPQKRRTHVRRFEDGRWKRQCAALPPPCLCPWAATVAGGLLFKILEQIGVGSGTMKGNGFGCWVDFINQHPIPLNMAVKAPFPLAVQGVVPATGRQRLFVNKQAHYIEDFAHIPAPFFR
ncbi:hypothetical protein FACS1894110_15530 [Spirochaetia bacterium]|nr:hypothetical protein FACS1894110_15530 [Spirochaetia bacterium]